MCVTIMIMMELWSVQRAERDSGMELEGVWSVENVSIHINSTEFFSFSKKFVKLNHNISLHLVQLVI